MDIARIFWGGYEPLVRTLVIGCLGYLALIVSLRIGGKRVLSKMNAFDFVVTVALGSTLASGLLSPAVSLAQVTLALLLLVCLQYVVAWLSVRVPWVHSVVTSRPVLLAYRGKLLDEAMLSERVTRDEVLAAVRDAGFSDLNNVRAVVLETDGSVSVVGDDRQGEGALGPVRGDRDEAS